MVIDTERGRWRCWRNKSHRGRHLYVLLGKILGCSYDVAKTMCGTVSLEDFESRVIQGLTGNEAEVDDGQWAEYPFPLHCKELRNGMPARHWGYLVGRGYDKTGIHMLRRYGVRACIAGDFMSRIVFPIWDWDLRMIGATGRAVIDAELRYKTEPRGPAAKCGFFGMKQIKEGGRRLYIVEGPLDACRMITLIPQKDRAVPLLGVNPTHEQLDIIRAISGVYKELVILMDADATARAMELQSELAVPSKLFFLPPGVKDPGEMKMLPDDWQ